MKTSDKILTFVAIFISCLALAVSIIQTRILQKQSQAAVWPRLDVLDSFGGDYYNLAVVNQGVGPAIISNVEYLFQDTTFYSILELAQYIGVEDGKKNNKKSVHVNIGYSEINEGRVIKPSESIDIYIAKDSNTVRLAHEYFDDLDIRLDYCSIYEHCWRYEQDEVTEL